MDIFRMAGTAQGRSPATAWKDLVFAVATAGAPDKGVTEQTAATLAKIDAHLAAAGTDRSRILSATVYVTDIDHKADMDKAWNAWIGPDNWPQRACIGVQLAGHDLVEIVVVAARSE